MITQLIQQIHAAAIRWSEDDGIQNSRVTFPNKLLRGGRSVLFGSTLTVGLLLGARQLSLLEPLEVSVFDRLTRMAPAPAVDQRLLIIGVTEQDLQKHGWPLSDATLAQLLQKLQSNQPRVVGLDLYRNIAQPPGQAKLTEQLRAANLIAITNVGSDPNAETVAPPPNIEDQRIGFNDLVLDPDGVVRRSLLFAETPEQEYYSFALRISLLYLAEEKPAFRYDATSMRIGKTEFRLLGKTSGGYQNLDARGYQTLLRYHGPNQLARQVSVAQVLSGEVKPEWIKDKVVLIGTTAPSIKDVFYTPYSASQTTEMMMPGIKIHGQIVSQILDSVAGKKSQYWFWSEPEKLLWLWSCSAVAGIFAWRFRHPATLAAVGLLSLGGIVGIGYGLFLQMGWIPLVEPVIGYGLTTLLVVAQRLFYSTYRDQLTGLLNRDAFLYQLRRSLKRRKAGQKNQDLAVVFLDLDQFKLINEGLGHATGDHLLISAAKRLRRALPKFSKLARVGGDEFAISLQHRTKDEITRVLDELQQIMAIPYHLEKQEVQLTVSAGLALTQAEYAHKPEDLLRDAHTAMYRAKSLGKSRYEVFATGMLKEAVERLQLESDIRQGIEAEEFLLYYQPIICLKTGRIAGFEALVRWQHHERGFMPPGLFIPLAEETGLIQPLGEWIFQQACHQAAQWQQQFPNYAALQMSINLSSSQFGQSNLIPILEQALKQAGLNGEAIKIEITESMVMGDVEAAIDLMLQIKSLGMKLSIDDFGTGYSSLSYLHRFPLDTLKVDRSFVSRMDESHEDSAIVQTIIALGQNMGMNIVAEGIEQDSQVQMLKALNCEYGQGYLFAKPLSSEAATDLLNQHPQW
ncbi:EAL domain-containing protein [filamentous cyanobacterium LEGE 11480]|uniref:EAL domain-containing protein n=1 Tax=Romeriopsis navalis LEGE 11480 TaxID=2777977 RepID=A0A928Z758_9CYAN|nr:EAL domain-containing protein [Romeriopsis navalis]MBE9032885.1 EAL domain-containing protein [Romeriopsis navalis LEGE 11480]